MHNPSFLTPHPFVYYMDILLTKTNLISKYTFIVCVISITSTSFRFWFYSKFQVNNPLFILRCSIFFLLSQNGILLHVTIVISNKVPKTKKEVLKETIFKNGEFTYFSMTCVVGRSFGQVEQVTII